jgi:hypothetical protein
MEELVRERAERRRAAERAPERVRAIERLRLARVDLERQRATTPHEGRRGVIGQAVAEVDRQIAALEADA